MDKILEHNLRVLRAHFSFHQLSRFSVHTEAYLDCGIRCEMSTYRVDGHLNAASKRHIKMSLSSYR